MRTLLMLLALAAVATVCQGAPSPDGTRIAYALDAGDASHIWTMRLDGSDKTPSTNDPAWIAKP